MSAVAATLPVDPTAPGTAATGTDATGTDATGTDATGTDATGTVAPPVDPLRGCADGRWSDPFVVVERAPGAGDLLEVSRAGDGRLALAHRVEASSLDDEFGSVLAGALAPWTDDHEVFARAFTGIVLSAAAGTPADAWRRFYANTLMLLHRDEPTGYAQVYRRALELLPTTSVVDLGCSFGFLSCHLADRGTDVVACDVDPGTTALLRRMARRLRRPMRVVTSSPHRVGLADRSADGVALLHVLEHVDADTGTRLLAEALRIARRRVVVAVPFEDTPVALFGHVRRFDLDDLRALGASSGWTFTVHDHVGGWLVLDRPAVAGLDHPAGDREREDRSKQIREQS